MGKRGCGAVCTTRAVTPRSQQLLASTQNPISTLKLPGDAGAGPQACLVPGTGGKDQWVPQRQKGDRPWERLGNLG